MVTYCCGAEADSKSPQSAGGFDVGASAWGGAWGKGWLLLEVGTAVCLGPEGGTSLGPAALPPPGGGGRMPILPPPGKETWCQVKKMFSSLVFPME